MLDVTDSFVEDLPDEATESMGDGPDCRLIPQSGQQTPENRLKMGALAPGCGVGNLTEYSPHVLVAFRGAAAAVLPSALFFPGTGSNPGSKFRRRWKGFGCHPYFSDDLLCGVDAKTGYFRQANDRILIWSLAWAIIVLSTAI